MSERKYDSDDAPMIDPTPEQWSAINQALTTSLQRRLKEQIPNPGDNPLLREILNGMQAGVYALQGRESENLEPEAGDTPLEQIRKELTYELRAILQGMGYPSQGAMFGMFLVQSAVPTMTWRSHSCSGACPPTGYGTCWFWC